MTIQTAYSPLSGAPSYDGIDRAVRERMMCLLREVYDHVVLHILWIEEMNRGKPYRDRSQLSLRIRLIGPMRMTLADEWAYITLHRKMDGTMHRQRHYISTRRGHKLSEAGVMRRTRNWERDATKELLVRIHEIHIMWGHLATVRRHLIASAEIAGEPFEPQLMPDIGLRRLIEASRGLSMKRFVNSNSDHIDHSDPHPPEHGYPASWVYRPSIDNNDDDDEEVVV